MDPEDLRRDVTNEAFNLCAAMIDADQRHTVDELEALIDAFGHRLPRHAAAAGDPGRPPRAAPWWSDRRTWLDEDSELFGILVDADAARGTHLAERYYERALDIAHVVASLDVMPADSELRPSPRCAPGCSPGSAIAAHDPGAPFGRWASGRRHGGRRTSRRAGRRRDRSTDTPTPEPTTRRSVRSRSCWPSSTS